MKNSEKSAFPFISFDNNGQTSEIEIGLTKREHFAGLAMQGLLTIFQDNEINPIVPNESNVNYMAELSVKAADALLKQLEE
mgnify:CR=1 FL=1